MRPGWKDVTSRSRGERDTPPQETELVVDPGRLRIVVHHHIDYEPKWLLSCRPSVFDMHLLDELALDDAQYTAEELVKARLHRWLTALKNRKKKPSAKTGK